MTRLRPWRWLGLALIAGACLTGIGSLLFAASGSSLPAIASRLAGHVGIVLTWHALLIAGLIGTWNHLPGWLGRPLSPEAARVWAGQRWRMAGWMLLFEAVLGLGWMS